MSRYPVIQLIPSAILRAAKQGNSDALEYILHYYDGYINALCKKAVFGSGEVHSSDVDLFMKRQLEIKLISAIVSMKY